MIELLGVEKDYGGRKILSIPHLDLETGIYWLQGSNGSGKTTFLKILSGILPFHGRIRFDGIDLKKQPLEYRACLGWADAEPQFPSFLTGKELVAFYTHVRKVNRNAAKELIDLLDMQDFLEQPVRDYSSGMTKKLSLILAFLGYPGLILLDEPLSTLDAAAIPILMDLIRKCCRERQITFIFSSHQDIKKEANGYSFRLLLENQTIVRAE